MSRCMYGMGKYLGSRGPLFDSDPAGHKAFWQADLDRNNRMKAEAVAEHDARVIALAKRQRVEILVELALHGLYGEAVQP